MGGELTKSEVSSRVKHRGTGHIVMRSDAIIYDFMPVLIGDQFRTNEILSKMLLRPAPEQGIREIQEDAYRTLSMMYLEKCDVAPALESYRLSLDCLAPYRNIVKGNHKTDILTDTEVRTTSIPKLERGLVRLLSETDAKYDLAKYGEWVEELRAAKKHWLNLDGNESLYGTIPYINACLKIGEYEEAIKHSINSGNPDLILRVQKAVPKEILNTGFIKKYIMDNTPKNVFDSEKGF